MEDGRASSAHVGPACLQLPHSDLNAPTANAPTAHRKWQPSAAWRLHLHHCWACSCGLLQMPQKMVLELQATQAGRAASDARSCCTLAVGCLLGFLLAGSPGRGRSARTLPPCYKLAQESALLQEAPFVNPAAGRKARAAPFGASRRRRRSARSLSVRRTPGWRRRRRL